MKGSETVVANEFWHGMHFQFGKGWEPKLISMYVAFDWVGISESKLIERCRVSGATVMQVCVSVGVSERWMKVKGTCGILLFS